ncbi:MAG: hypothetical protein U9Q78_00240 [Chloroflexota bacterium]|nr:hypothetical protein [Chloroflexota bacterium]
MTKLLLLLLVISEVILAACGGASKEPALVIYTDGTRGCKEQPKPVTLWDRAGAGAAHGRGIGKVPHGTKLKVGQTEEFFGVRYYQVVYEGQRGWLPENYTSNTRPLCPQSSILTGLDQLPVIV